MAIVDIVLIAFVALFAIIGLFRGFLKVFINMFGGLASLAIAILLAKPAAQLINKIYNVTGLFSNLFSGIFAPNLPELSNATGAEFVDGMSNTSEIIKGALTRFVDVSATYTDKTQFLGTLSNALGALAMIVATVILLFVLIRIAVALLSKIFDASTKNRTIGGIDKFLGFVLGALKGALIVAIVFLLIYFLGGVSLVADNVGPIIENSTVTKYLFNLFSTFLTQTIETTDFPALLLGLFGHA